MRGVLIVVVAAVALVAGGCTLLDAFSGVDAEGNHIPGGGGVSVVAPIVDRVIPGGGLLLGAVTTIWAAIRGRAWKRAAIATFDTIEAAGKAHKSVVDLKGDLKSAHEKAGVGGIVKAVVERYDHKEVPAT